MQQPEPPAFRLAQLYAYAAGLNEMYDRAFLLEEKRATDLPPSVLVNELLHNAREMIEVERTVAVLNGEDAVMVHRVRRLDPKEEEQVEVEKRKVFLFSSTTLDAATPLERKRRLEMYGHRLREAYQRYLDGIEFTHDVPRDLLPSLIKKNAEDLADVDAVLDPPEVQVDSPQKQEEEEQHQEHEKLSCGKGLFYRPFLKHYDAFSGDHFIGSFKEAEDAVRAIQEYEAGAQEQPQPLHEMEGEEQDTKPLKGVYWRAERKTWQAEFGGKYVGCYSDVRAANAAVRAKEAAAAAGKRVAIKGVTYHSVRKQWEAKTRKGIIGYFESAEDANRAVRAERAKEREDAQNVVRVAVAKARAKRGAAPGRARKQMRVMKKKKDEDEDYEFEEDDTSSSSSSSSSEEDDDDDEEEERLPGVNWHAGKRRWQAFKFGNYLGVFKKLKDANDAVRSYLKALGGA
jgi:hypothetical protein